MWAAAWPSLQITNLERALTDVEALVARPPSSQPDDVTRALARFLVVRTCGYLEQCVEECLGAHLTSKASPQVSAYGKSWLGRGANPTPERLVTLVRRFDRDWADELKAIFDDNDQLLQREISLLVDRRNKIAHGLSEGLGSQKALQLLSYSREVADWFILRFDPR